MAAQEIAVPRIIDKWTAIKLEHLGAYLQGYMNATRSIGECYYIDGFAGCGDCILRGAQLPVEGSPWRAMRTVPAFSACFFIEEHRPSSQHLENRIKEESIGNSSVLVGDCTLVDSFTHGDGSLVDMILTTKLGYCGS